MINISISDAFGKNVDLRLDSGSIAMISRFLHFISLADHTLYHDSESIKNYVSDFYESNYDTTMIQDSKLLKSVFDYMLNRLS